MKQSRNLKIGILTLAVVLVAAAILGVGLGQDFTDGYIIRISSAQEFAQATEDKIRDEFGSSLGELRIQYATENYNEQLLIHVQEAEQADAQRMVEIAAEDNSGAYLRSFDEVKNPAGKKLFWRFSIIIAIVYVLGAAYLWYRQGMSGGVSALAAGSAALLLTIALQNVAGLHLGEASYLGVSILAIVFAQMMSYLLNNEANAKVGLLAGEDADMLAKKAWAGGRSKVIVLTAVTAIFALTGCIVAEGVLRGFMTAILMGACASALATVLIGLPTYVLFAAKYMLKSGAKKKAKSIR